MAARQKRKPIERRQQTSEIPLPECNRGQAVLRRFDTIVADLENKWGIGRLEGLVPIDLSEKVVEVHRRARKSILDGRGHDEVEAEYESLIRGWQTMDRLAEKAGHKPIEKTQLETITESGELVVIVPDGVRGESHGRDCHVWSMKGVREVLSKFYADHEAKVLSGVMDHFPGARVERVQARGPEPDDEIPF